MGELYWDAMSNSLPIREAFSHYTLSRNFRNCHRIFTIQSSFWKHSILIFYTIMVKKKIIIMTLLADLVCRIFFFLESEMFPYNFCKIDMGGGVKMMLPSFITCYFIFQDIRIILHHRFRLQHWRIPACIYSLVR